jgi:hypothetical protein
METGEKYASLKHSKFGRNLVITAIAGFGILTLIATRSLYPIRNHKPDEVAARFLKNNEDIRSEVGEITNIIGYGSELPDKSKEIAEKLKTGEKLSYINTAKENDNAQTVLTGDGYGFWQSSKLIGTKKTVEVRLYLQKNDYGEFGNIFYYTVTEAKYRDETGDWKNKSIGWLENYFLLFK